MTTAELPLTLQELVLAEDRTAADLRATTGSILDLVAEFEKRHAALVHRQAVLAKHSGDLSSKITTVQSALKRLTFPPHMARMAELLREFVDEDSDMVTATEVPSELIRFVATASDHATGSASSPASGKKTAIADNYAIGLPPMSRDEQMRFASLFVEGGVLESRGGDLLNQQYFGHAGRQCPPPHVLARCDNPDEALLDLAFVPFAVEVATAAASTTTTTQLRHRSPLTDVGVMRSAAVGGRVLVSKREYKPGTLIFCESPFLSVPRSTTALLPSLPPLLQRVVREMLALPQAQAAMRRQGWDPQLMNCVLVYLAMQTFDAMARQDEGTGPSRAPAGGGGGGGADDAKSDSGAAWMWRAPAPLFRYTSGDFCGEDPAAKRRMRKMLFLGAPLQAMDTAAVHQQHKLAKFVFAALPPCYRDFEGDESAARAACLDWARRGVTAAFDNVDEQQPQQQQQQQGAVDDGAAGSKTSTATMTPYDDNPAHRQVPVSPLGRESCVTAESGGAAAQAVQEIEAAMQLPPDCRVSVSDIVRIFSVFQTNCVALRDDRGFFSSTVAGIESAAGRAFSDGAASLPPPAPRNGLFTFMSMLEHACCPNVVWAPTAAAPGAPAGTLELRALRHIAPGERLRVAYVPPVLPAMQRRQRLRANYHFVCACEACTGTDWARVMTL